MNKLIRFSSGLLRLGVLGGVMLASDLACPPHWVGGQRPSLPDERGREAKLREMHEATHRRREAKRQVAEEVIAQRQTLAEAIEQFRILDRQWPECPPSQPSRRWGSRRTNWTACVSSITSSRLWPTALAKRPRSSDVWRRSSRNSWPIGRSAVPRQLRVAVEKFAGR